jgi:hypothetical protein
LKVSKPIIIALVLAILFSAYTFFFTGKKKPPSKTPLPADTVTTPLQPSPQPSVLPLEQPEVPVSQISKVNFIWDRDPFQLPKLVDEQRIEKPRIGLKLVAVLESKKGRLAIIGNDVVEKGDFIGDEQIQDILKDRIILVRTGQRRIIPVASMVVDKASIKEPSAEVRK